MYRAWIVPMAALLVPVNLFIFRHAVPRHRDSERAAASAFDVSHRGVLVAFLAQDYTGQVLMRAAVTVVPIIVVARVGPEANARFYVPFSIVIAIDMIVWSVTTSVLAEGAYDGARLREHVRTVTRRFGPPLLAGVVAVVAGAHVLLLPFGADYAREGDDVLRLLGLAIVPRASVLLAGAVWRIQGHGGRLLAIEALMLVVLMAPLVPFADAAGLTGVAFAWLASATMAGVMAEAFLLRFLRGSG